MSMITYSVGSLFVRPPKTDGLSV